MIAILAGLLVTLTALAQSPNTSKTTLGSGTNVQQIEFVKIAPGEFEMGCVPGDMDCLEDEVPRHKVRLTKGFEFGKYEVTQAQWEAVMGSGSNPSEIEGPMNPVDSVNKEEIRAFLLKLNARKDGYTYRLPTEAEWEYAARAGAADPSREMLGEYAWFDENSDDESHPVGLKKPNAWGLYDMLGNVREWVDDQAAYYANIAPSEVSIDPKGPRPGDGIGGGGGAGRGAKGYDSQGRLLINGGGYEGLPIFRGGGWDNFAPYLRISSRYYYYGTDLKVSDIGFRLVRQAK